MIDMLILLVGIASVLLILFIQSNEDTKKEIKELKKEIAILKEENERIKYISSIKKNK